MLKLIAHAGEVHEASPNFFETVYGVILINLAPFLALVLLVLAMRHLLRLKRDIQLVIALAYLLLVGLLGYSLMPVASIVSLVAGFGVCLTLVIWPNKTK